MSKRANPPLEFTLTRTFRQQWDSLNKSGRFPMPHLKHVMMLVIMNDGPLPPQFKDHPLKGRLDGDKLVFTATGTHSELFGH
ncbi:type II toxin-antitoxin system mRNA interferase toxin, RelE/StbE family [Niveispirillum sp. KHB5.9]|uniref:type II toxin-antitoxin system mRNA interferase toxin, RelE/StbE family n=1 Tax=Niveispirillum sp. KHB5.9 TaxID=3400269 RepID=UPI003A84F489